MDQRKLDRLADTAAKLEELTEHPSWRVLTRIFEEKRTKRFANLAKRLMTSDDPMDQRKLDYERGYWAGVGHVLANPERAVRTVEEALKRAQALDEE